ncbi:ATP-binding protein [uncultured Fibrobacter sp.]|uniref:ATP-binding protein n=1 Tax=uncultured Fibrobacter sp. TaxID=261512 RepID=UPI0025D2C39B|nr:ATP-binding protein [uncultured Fibrobacter sp.]
MKIAIQNQRKERDRLLGLPYIPRQTIYDFDELLKSPNIKLLTGPRRVGKSTQALLMLRGKNFAYLNFDDNELLNKWDEQQAEQLLSEIYPNYEYLLLDEVQNIDGWDVWVNKLYRRGVNLVITGSNAKMLSGEMATVLTGRYLEINMQPFSLAEASQFAGRLGNAEKIQDDFLKNGGYPETFTQRSITPSYLQALFDSILYKDIVRRHKIRNATDLNNVAMFLLSNFTGTFSYNDVADDLGLSSVSTTKKFMDYLHEPFLFYYLDRYNNKLKLMKKAPRKVYVVDNGFVASKAFNLSDNLGKLLENQVFVELLHRGYDTEKTLFYYHSRNDKETDFVLREGNKVKELIQVCYDMSKEKTIKREVDSIVECAGELGCDNLTIVTWNEERTIEKKGYTIKIVPVGKF